GWVANKLPLFLRFFFNGTSIYMEAVAEFALSTSRGSPLIFLKAFIKPTGLRVNSTAVVSARYSRFLETASWTNCAASGAKMTKTRAIMASQDFACCFHFYFVHHQIAAYVNPC